METWTILAMEITGNAKRARVQHRRPNGTTVTREYGWPREIARGDMITVLDAEHRKVLQEPEAPPTYDETFELVGQTRDIGTLPEAPAPTGEAAPGVIVVTP